MTTTVNQLADELGVSTEYVITVLELLGFPTGDGASVTIGGAVEAQVREMLLRGGES